MPGGGIHNWQQGVGLVVLVTGSVLWMTYEVLPPEQRAALRPAAPLSQSSPASQAPVWDVSAGFSQLLEGLTTVSPMLVAAVAGLAVVGVGVAGALMLWSRHDEDEPRVDHGPT